MILAENRVLLQVQHRSTAVLLPFLAGAGCKAPGSKFDTGAQPRPGFSTKSRSARHAGGCRYAENEEAIRFAGGC